FRFSYCTNDTSPVDLTIAFYVSENGHNTEDSQVVKVESFIGLPGRNPESPNNCYQFDVDLPDPEFDQFTLAGEDLDGDGRVDFGYGMIITNCGTCNGTAGPMIADGPITTSPGSTPDYDVFFPPKWAGGEYVRTDTGPAGTLGQVAMRLYTPT